MAPHGKVKRDGYPLNSKYFQELMDERSVKEIWEASIALCDFLWSLPEGYVNRFNSQLGKHEWKLLSYFPNIHATGGNTSLRRY